MYRRPNFREPAPQPKKNPLLYKKMTRKELWATCITFAVAVLLIFFFETHHQGKKQPAAQNNTQQSSQQTTDSFNKTQYSLTDPASMWVLVNKKHQLSPKTYTPTDLTVPDVPQRVPGNETMQMRKMTADALTQLFGGAKDAGFNLMVASGYRSYNYQLNLYNGYVSSIGQAQADKTSARPGYSEHQTGLSVDVEPTTRKCELDTCFGTMPEGQWVAANAYKYGFIIRYPSDKVSVTGYEYEPWHVRYVGVDLATEMHNKGLSTLEEFFGTPGGDYNN